MALVRIDPTKYEWAQIVAMVAARLGCSLEEAEPKAREAMFRHGVRKTECPGCLVCETLEVEGPESPPPAGKNR